MNLKSATCACGSAHWHAMMGDVFWCRKCGAFRKAFEDKWQIPLDRSGDVSTTELSEEEVPTKPDLLSKFKKPDT